MVDVPGRSASVDSTTGWILRNLGPVAQALEKRVTVCGTHHRRCANPAPWARRVSNETRRLRYIPMRNVGRLNGSPFCR
jgi:hypothetical protein